MSRVVVIGAGVGGLSAAIHLASRGARVSVIEASPDPGGKAGVIYRDGVEVDTGPSVLTLPEVFSELFRVAGRDMAEEVELVRTNPAFSYRYPDGFELLVHHELERTLASVKEGLGGNARDQLADFLRYAENIWEAGGPHFVFGRAPTLGSVLRLGLSNPKKVLQIDSMRGMRQAIRERVREPHLAALLLRYATYNGSNPFTAPATLNCISWVELGLGGFGVAGGVHALIRALVRAACDLGVDFRYAEPVRRILTENRRVTGVETDRSVVIADAVVANADVAHLAAALLPNAEHGLAPPSAPSMSAYTAIYAPRRQRKRRAHTVLFPEEYAEEFRDIFDRDRPPDDPTVYACAQEVCHRRAGWPDREPLFVMANAPAEPEQGTREGALLDALSRRVGARLVASGMIDPEDEAIWRRTPADLARRFPDTRGALYGAASNSALAAFRRPRNRVNGVPGLYLASGSAHPGGGLPLAALSGRAAAWALLEDLTTRARRPA